jgi:hypothetical protein
MVSVDGFAAKERVIRFQNHVRLGYDDNVYRTQNNEKGSAYLTDIVNISGKLNFSSRTDALLYWQPEFRFRFDADPEFVTYQDFYARLNHAISQRTFLTVSDRFRYQDQGGQTGSGVNSTDNQYIENDLSGALDVTLNAVSSAKVGLGYEFRTWDDANFGVTRGNDYDQFRGNASYIRQLRENTTQGTLGVMFTDHSYEGSRGGFSSLTAFGGVDQNFNPNLTGYGRLGYTGTSLDNSQSGDSSSPYLSAGLNFSPTARTSLNGSIGYNQSKSENSVYNMQDRFNLLFGARHDLTAKINIAGSIGYIFSYYQADYARLVDQNGNPVTAPDTKDNYFKLTVRGSYQVNRNNFLEAGWLFETRDADSSFLSKYDRNQVDVAWRLRL